MDEKSTQNDTPLIVNTDKKVDNNDSFKLPKRPIKHNNAKPLKHNQFIHHNPYNSLPVNDNKNDNNRDRHSDESVNNLNTTNSKRGGGGTS